MNKIINCFCLILFFNLIYLKCFTQELPPVTIYKDSYVSVDLVYRLYPCTTDPQGKNSRFSLIITGTSRGTDLYLNWRMEYYNCHSSISCEIHSFNIGIFKSPGKNFNQDWEFSGYKMATPFFDVTTSIAPDRTPCPEKPLVSSQPDSIEGRKQICQGEKDILLTVKGGRLAAGAQWVWYRDSIESKSIGSGNNIKVTPVKNTTYLVRAEGATNNTASSSINISIVREELQEPAGIKSDGSICQGKPLVLNVEGGLLAGNAQWVWYQDSYFNKVVGRGASVTVYPASNTTYYVRGEGICYTNGKSTNIRVLPASVPPSRISQSYSGKRIMLSVVGGSLGTNSLWVWYKNNCATGENVGSGSNIIVKQRKPTTYYVRAEGDCNTTNCVYSVVSKSRVTRYHVEREEFINLGVVSNFRSPGGSKASDVVKQIADSRVVSITYGKLEKSGAYIRGKFDLNFKTGKYSTNNKEVFDYASVSNASNYYVFNGNTLEKRVGITGGFVWGLGRALFLQAGAGYGKRQLLWGIDEISNQNNQFQGQAWAKNITTKFEGVEAEAGFTIKAAMFNFMFSSNAIYHTGKAYISTQSSRLYVDFSIGLGYSFKAD